MASYLDIRIVPGKGIYAKMPGKIIGTPSIDKQTTYTNPIMRADYMHTTTNGKYFGLTFGNIGSTSNLNPYGNTSLMPYANTSLMSIGSTGAYLPNYTPPNILLAAQIGAQGLVQGSNPRLLSSTSDNDLTSPQKGLPSPKTEVTAIDELQNNVSSNKGADRINPSEIAQNWQGAYPYVGVDKYRDITLKKGKIIYVGEPYPTGYATTKRAVNRINGDSRKMFEGLQVKPYWEDGMDAAEYRSKMMAYEIAQDIDVAFGITKANPQFGEGGAPQMFIPDFNELVKKGVIKKVESKAIQLHNYKMPLDEYNKMMDKLEELK